MVFAPFWSENISVWNRGYGLLGNYGSALKYLPFQYQMSKKLKKTFAHRNGFKEILFVGVLIYVMMTIS